MSVKRFEHDWDYNAIVEEPDGAYILYSDYAVEIAAYQGALAAQEGRINAIKEHCKELEHRIWSLEK